MYSFDTVEDEGLTVGQTEGGKASRMAFAFLDKAFDLEKVGKNLVDLGAGLDEFPNRVKPNSHASSHIVTTAGEFCNCHFTRFLC